MRKVSVRIRPIASLFSASLVLVLSIVCQTRAATVGNPSTIIHVWSVGSPFTGALPQTQVPAGLERQAQALDYTIVVEHLRSAEFLERFRHAFQDHTQPEILTFDNFGILMGVNTPFGRYQGLLNADYGIASSLVMVYESLAGLQPRGWVTLVPSAINYEAAKTLAMQPPRCREEDRASESSLSLELKQAGETATAATRAYLSCDLQSLTAFVDESKMGSKCFLPEYNLHVDTIQNCGVSGNDRIAFVSLAGRFTGQMREPAPRRDLDYARWLTNTALGQQSILAILRKQGDGWRLLAISDDPLVTNASTDFTLRRLTGLLTIEMADITIPSPAQLITADGSNLRPPPHQVFGNFGWTPSVSPDVIGEVTEFLVGDDSSPRQRTRLFFLLRHERSLSSGRLWGVSGRWRVWSISRAGNVSLTESRSYLEW